MPGISSDFTEQFFSNREWSTADVDILLDYCSDDLFKHAALRASPFYNLLLSQPWMQSGCVTKEGIVHNSNMDSVKKHPNLTLPITTLFLNWDNQVRSRNLTQLSSSSIPTRVEEYFRRCIVIAMSYAALNYKVNAAPDTSYISDALNLLYSEYNDENFRQLLGSNPTVSSNNTTVSFQYREAVRANENQDVPASVGINEDVAPSLPGAQPTI